MSLDVPGQWPCAPAAFPILPVSLELGSPPTLSCLQCPGWPWASSPVRAEPGVLGWVRTGGDSADSSPLPQTRPRAARTQVSAVPGLQQEQVCQPGTDAGLVTRGRARAD